MSIGSRIRAERNKQKMSQAKLGAMVDLSQSALSELETGESATTSLVASIADALGVSAYWLETGKGEKYVGGGRASSPADNVSAGEVAELIALYGRLGPDERALVLQTIRGLSSTDNPA